MSLDKARWRLAVLWFPACGLLFLVLVLQSLGGALGSDLQRAWGWALPNFLPTIALMLSVFASDALRPGASSRFVVEIRFCTLSIGLSIFYLAMLLLSILSPPLVNYFRSPADHFEEMAILETSSIWLAPLQALVVIALGVLFFLKEEKAS